MSRCHIVGNHISRLKWYLTNLTNFSMKQLVLSKVYIDLGGIKQLHHGLSTQMGEYPLAKARGLSPRPVLLRNPILCDFSGGGGPPVSPSGSAHICSGKLADLSVRW